MPAAGHISPFMADSFIEYARTRKLAADLDSYTLEDLLRGHFSSEADQLLALLTKEELDIPFCKQQQRCLGILERISGPLSNLMEARRERARRTTPLSSRLLQTASSFLTWGIPDPYLQHSRPSRANPSTSSTAGKTKQIRPQMHNMVRRRSSSCRRKTMYRTTSSSKRCSPPCSGGVVDFDEQGHPCHEIFMPAPSMRKALDAARIRAVWSMPRP